MPEVQFLSWDDPFLPAAARALAARFSQGSALDLGTTLIAVPGARAGRRLLELLVDQASVHDLRLVPPHRILTAGTLPEELYRPSLPLASGATVRRSWVRAMERAPSGVILEALGPYALEADATGKVAYARALDALNRAVGGAGLSFRDVARECRQGFLFSDEERWEALSRIQGGMRSILAEAGRVDREEARWEALRSGVKSTSMTPVLVGVAELPLVTRRMLEGVAEGVLALVHAPETMAEAFDALGTIRTDYWQDWGIPIQDRDLVVRDGPKDQAAELLASLGELAGKYALDEITIGVPDPSLVPYLAQQLEAHGYKSRYAEGTPLSLASPVQLLKAIADYLGGGRFGALANLLRHPDLPVALKPEMAPEMADTYFERHLPDLVVPGHLLDGPPGSGGLSEIQDRLHGPEFLGQLEGTAALSEWMLRILSLLASVYGDRVWEPDPHYHRQLLEASMLIRDAAEALHQLPPGLDERCSGHQALRILLGELRDGRIPPEAEEAAVEMVGWLELQLDDAPVVLLTGVGDPFLPEAVNADPFLPNALRSRLGLEDNRARYARDAYRLTTLVKSTQARVIIAGRRTAAGDPLRPSRLLLTGTDEELAGRILMLTGADPAADGRRPKLPPGPDNRARSRFPLPPEPHIHLPEIPRPLPVTAFRALLEDPYLWALQSLLGLEEPGYDLQELDPMGFGTLAHEILEQFARSPEAGSPDPEAIRRRLDTILTRRVERIFGPNPLPTVPLQVEQLRTRLRAFAEWQAEWVEEGWEIYCSEARTPAGGVPFDVDGIPVFLSGRIDRIDRNRTTGSWMVFDYKTGDGGADPASVRGRDGDWKDLQLPLYRHLLDGLQRAEGAGLEPPAPGVRVDLAYLPLSKDTGRITPAVAGWTPADLETAEETARKVIRSLREAGGISFDPVSSGRKARGDLAVLLGRGLFQTEGDEE
ncbi:MAG: PD-(D/E)XK nuclease family protein [Gemmatimonadota bacterium]